MNYKGIKLLNQDFTQDLANIDKSSFFYFLRLFNLVGNFLFPLYRCCFPLFLSGSAIPLVGDGLGQQVCKNQLEVGEGAKLEMIKEVGENASRFAFGECTPQGSKRHHVPSVNKIKSTCGAPSSFS